MVICVYHDNCMDGLSSAWVVSTYFKDYSIKLIPASYGRNLNLNLNKCSQLIVVDYSFSLEEFREYSSKVEEIIWIDHHETSEEIALSKKLPRNIKIIHNKQHCGAVLTWNYFFSFLEIPKFLLYVEDRDLWKWELPNSKEINTGINSYGFNLDNIPKFFDLDNMKEEGKILLRQQENNINQLLKNVIRFNLCGYNVPCLNTPPFYISEAGSILAKNEPFSLLWYDTDEYTSISLRSSKDGIDVSKIAKKFGGGGHINAAGFNLEHNSINYKTKELNIVR